MYRWAGERVPLGVRGPRGVPWLHLQTRPGTPYPPAANLCALPPVTLLAFSLKRACAVKELS